MSIAEQPVAAHPRFIVWRLRRRWIVAFVVLLVALWLAAGTLRAADLARAYFVGSHDPAQTLANVTVDGVGLAIFPPFWQVAVSGDVIEPGNTWVSYRLYMNVWVEPLSGFAFANGSG